MKSIFISLMSLAISLGNYVLSAEYCPEVTVDVALKLEFEPTNKDVYVNRWGDMTHNIDADNKYRKIYFIGDYANKRHKLALNSDAYRVGDYNFGVHYSEGNRGKKDYFLNSGHVISGDNNFYNAVVCYLSFGVDRPDADLVEKMGVLQVRERSFGLNRTDTTLRFQPSGTRKAKHPVSKVSFEVDGRRVREFACHRLYDHTVNGSSKKQSDLHETSRKPVNLCEVQKALKGYFNVQYRPDIDLN